MIGKRIHFLALLGTVFLPLGEALRDGYTSDLVIASGADRKQL